jgi:hypothetical protein
MSQRIKARVMAAKAGYGKDVANLTVQAGNKGRALAIGSHGTSKDNTVFDAGEMMPATGMVMGGVPAMPKLK